MPNHPKAKYNGCVLEHRLIAEQIVGRTLKDSEVVHHIDEDKTNNSIDNLIVFVSDSDHNRFHKTGIMIINDDNTYYSPIEIKDCIVCGKPFHLTKKQVKYCSQECFKFDSRTVEGLQKKNYLN